MIGTELASRYRVVRVLGEGGMGHVYEAVDQQLGRHVAIKLIREGSKDPGAHERFLREARAAAALSHPNACQLYEVGEHESRPFLVMELLEGESLEARLGRGPMTKDEVVGVIVPLMGALTALHEAGLIHRDLKPANVFLTPQGVKLLDFGLARLAQTSTAQTVASLTMPGAVTGTVRYMAPEQIAGDPLDTRTDIFALGVLMFEMLTGRPPFDATSNVNWVNAVLTGAPASLDAPELHDLDPIVGRALQRRPDERYTSVAEMAAALEAATTTAATQPATSASSNGTSSNGASSNGFHRTAVLPFRVIQSDPELAPLQEIVPEALTSLLSNRPSFKMVSHRLAQPFADATDLVAIGQQLHVDRLVTGTILRAGDELRVTTQLIDATDGAVHWSHTGEHTVTSVAELQDAICQQIADQLPDD